uniref:NADH dehydrogenase subunit 4L n=1 Tax=Paramarcius puncticeps TaxID=2924071 RepID=UPI001FA7CF1A|nr:NADH dehydrogenase subunit 4L [Paramarcius puncticeps]UMY75892.1 NADH dehydrogenase subunit 4L [Paramarcius puncticeps]
MYLIDLCFLIMFFSGFISFSLSHKHLLLSLFSLEFLSINLFLVFFLFLYCFGYELYFIMIFLVFIVCEGSLGLAIIVNMIRSHGNDLLSSMSILSW